MLPLEKCCSSQNRSRAHLSIKWDKVCVKVSDTYYIFSKGKLTLTLGGSEVGGKWLGPHWFPLVSDQGTVEEAGTAFRGSPSSSRRKCSPCPAAPGMFRLSGKWTELEKRVETGNDVYVREILGISETCSGRGPGWAIDGPRETIWPSWPLNFIVPHAWSIRVSMGG